jgi:uncharacterized membrane protein YjdF
LSAIGKTSPASQASPILSIIHLVVFLAEIFDYAYLKLTLLLLHLVLESLILLFASSKLDFDISQTLLQFIDLGLSNFNRLPGLIILGLSGMW